jgi:hypothetical protein
MIDSGLPCLEHPEYYIAFNRIMHNFVTAINESHETEISFYFPYHADGTGIVRSNH